MDPAVHAPHVNCPLSAPESASLREWLDRHNSFDKRYRNRAVNLAKTSSYSVSLQALEDKADRLATALSPKNPRLRTRASEYTSDRSSHLALQEPSHGNMMPHFREWLHIKPNLDRGSELDLMGVSP
jgi:hypothetical protein